MYRSEASPQRSVVVLGVRGHVYGKDRQTGQTLWKHDTDVPSVVELAVCDDRVFASTGREIWAIEYPSGRLIGRQSRTGSVRSPRR